MFMKILSPAKINIGLRVYPKNSEYGSFHKIESIFQTVNLFDEIEAEFSDENTSSCNVECDSLVLPKENTLTKTFDAFRKNACILDSRSVNVKLTKRIPSGGGLGGGSSNAAFFLKLLSRLYDVELTRELAFSVAEEVGSDVFFFLGLKNGAGAALVSGRGEKVKEIESRKLNLVLVFPDVFSSTKEAYSLVDESYATLENALSGYIDFADYERLYNSDLSEWSKNENEGCGFKNSFTPVMEKKYPLILDAIRDLKNAGAVFADMTGSGSVVFGVFRDEKSSCLALETLCKKWKCVSA